MAHLWVFLPKSDFLVILKVRAAFLCLPCKTLWFFHIPNPVVCLYLSYQEVQVALPRQFSVFHFLHLCWNCNCYQWSFSLLQVMNINVKPQSTKTWSCRLLLLSSPVERLFQFLLFRQSKKPCHLIFCISDIARGLEEYGLLSLPSSPHNVFQIASLGWLMSHSWYAGLSCA